MMIDNQSSDANSPTAFRLIDFCITLHLGDCVPNQRDCNSNTKAESSEMGTCMHLLRGSLLRFQDRNILGVISGEFKGTHPPNAILFRGKSQASLGDFEGTMKLAQHGFAFSLQPRCQALRH